MPRPSTPGRAAQFGWALPGWAPHGLCSSARRSCSWPGRPLLLAVWWGASRETQIANYPVVGTLNAIDLDLGEASVEITGGASGPVEVQRTDEFAFGRPPRESVSVQVGVLRIASRCPDTVLGTCRARYRISVRDNVQLNVQTTSGPVRVIGLNASARITTGSGDIAVDGFCGFQLTALSASGSVRGAASCSPDRVQLRSNSGDVHAIVPTGRYRVDANSDVGSARVRNLVVADDAPYAVQAISGSGDVLVDGRR